MSPLPSPPLLDVDVDIDVHQVWSFGAGQKGQLGHESTNREDFPRLVRALKRTRWDGRSPTALRVHVEEMAVHVMQNLVI